MIVYRLVKGAPLTITELDDNFHDVDNRITFIEDNPPEARSIDEIVQVGNSLVVLYTDSTEDGPFQLPTISLRDRGDWTPATGYLVNDLVKANGLVYLVMFAHTSEATFDAGANDGSGHDFYALLFAIPELQIPPGGDDGFVLSKASNSDFDMEWQARGLPDGGSTGDVLTKQGGDDLDADWAAPAQQVPVSQKITDSTFTPTTDDLNTFTRCTNASGCTITITSGVFDIDTELAFRQDNDDSIELVEGDSSVILDGVAGFDNRTATRGAMLFCKFVEDTSDGELWQVWGGPLVETSV